MHVVLDLHVDLAIERFHERIAHIFRHLLFQGRCDIMAGIGSKACWLQVPAIMSYRPREIPELYAKPYSLTVNVQSLHFYFSCMHSARMLRSVGKNNTDCPVLSCNLSILLLDKYVPGRTFTMHGQLLLANVWRN